MENITDHKKNQVCTRRSHLLSTSGRKKQDKKEDNQGTWRARVLTHPTPGLASYSLVNLFCSRTMYHQDRGS